MAKNTRFQKAYSAFSKAFNVFLTETKECIEENCHDLAVKSFLLTDQDGIKFSDGISESIATYFSQKEKSSVKKVINFFPLANQDRLAQQLFNCKNFISEEFKVNYEVDNPSPTHTTVTIELR